MPKKMSNVDQVDDEIYNGFLVQSIFDITLSFNLQYDIPKDRCLYFGQYVCVENNTVK